MGEGALDAARGLIGVMVRQRGNGCLYCTAADAINWRSDGSFSPYESVRRRFIRQRLRRFTGLGGCFCKLQRCGEKWIGYLVNSSGGHAQLADLYGVNPNYMRRPQIL